jgi:predicted O-methyltransferase YrrM
MELLPFSREIIEYAEKFSSPEDEVLASLSRYTYLKVVHPRMLCSPFQGKFLELLSHMLQPSLVLEIGTYTGYSAICLARGIKPGGKLISLEINDELAPISTKFFKESGLEHKIELKSVDAIQAIPDLPDNIDLVYIDGEKEQYSEYLKLVLPKLKTGAYILADNTLWDGKVVFDKLHNDPATKALRLFNQEVRDHPGLTVVILPIRDGLSLIRKSF